MPFALTGATVFQRAQSILRELRGAVTSWASCCATSPSISMQPASAVIGNLAAKEMAALDFREL